MPACLMRGAPSYLPPSNHSLIRHIAAPSGSPSSVAVSAAVPGLFAPLVVSTRQLAGITVNPGFRHHKRVNLSDGGVRDNQGLTTLFFGDVCDYVICSDASGLIDANPKPSKLAVNVLLRSNTITMDATRDWIVQMLYRKKEVGEIRQMAFFDLRDEVQDGAAGLPPELIGMAAGIRTDLDYFDDDEIFVLKYHGYTLADRIGRYAQELIQSEAVDPHWVEDFSQARVAALRHALRHSHNEDFAPTSSSRSVEPRGHKDPTERSAIGDRRFEGGRAGNRECGYGTGARPARSSRKA